MGRRHARGLRVANARGVGAIHDKDGWLGAHAIFGRIHETGGLTLRVWQSLPARAASARLGELGLRSRIGDDYLRLGYLKTFMDGTLGSQTAWMLDGTGVCITSGEELAELVRAAAAAGWPVGVHAIGDRANREALDAFEATRDVWEPLGLRQRIEHAQCLDPADLPRFAGLGVACSVQFSHAPSDRDLAERFWGDRLDGTYAFGTLLEAGAVVANGSDAPVEELDPLAGIAAGVRRTIDERPAWRTEEALTVEEALHATTVDAGLARRRRAPPREAPARLPRRPRRARPRPVSIPADELDGRARRRDDGRRPLGAQPAPLGLRRSGRGVGSSDASPPSAAVAVARRVRDARRHRLGRRVGAPARHGLRRLRRRCAPVPEHRAGRARARASTSSSTPRSAGGSPRSAARTWATGRRASSRSSRAREAPRQRSS